MTKPANLLDKYESYSVHHVIIACRSTVRAESITSRVDVDMARVNNAVNAAKYLGDVVRIDDSAQDAFLVLDTRRFSQYYVESLRYDVNVNGLAKTGSHTHLVSELKMQIIDESGISFAKFLQWIMDDRLKTNFDGLVFVLKTIFIGHESDGRTSEVHAECIPMTLVRMDVNLDYAKGVYEMEFAPNVNFNAITQSRYLNIATATTAWTKPGGKLGAVVQSFEDNLNNISKKFYDDIQREANAAINGSDYESNGKAPIKYGRLIQYMITIPPSWNDFEFAGSNIGFVPEQKAEKAPPKTQVPMENGKPSLAGSAISSGTNTTGGVGSAYASAARGTSIMTALDGIFKQVYQIAEMGNFTKEPGKDNIITFYKHIIGLTSSDTNLIVHVDVVEFRIPNVQALQTISNDKTSVSTNMEEFITTTTIKDATDTQAGVGKVSPKIVKDLLEWDYIFTSKNDSILSFDLKIQDFNALFQGNLRVGDGAIRESIDNASAPKPASATEAIFLREYDPVLMPENTAEALKNFRDSSMLLKNRAEQGVTIQKIQKYHQNLTAFYATNTSDVVMTIRGNPEIFKKFNIGEVLKHTEITDKTAYRKDLEDRIIRANPGKFSKDQSGSFSLTALSEKSYTATPVFAKLNIRGPNVDFLSNGAGGSKEDYSTTLFEDNFYTVVKVAHIFNRSVFTQEINLCNFNIYTPIPKVKK